MLTSDTESSSQFFRWRAELDQYDFIIKFIKGTTNVLADAMSRMMVNEPVMNLEEENEDETINIIMKLISEGKTNARMPKEMYSLNQNAKILWARRGELIVEANNLYLQTDKGYKRLVLPWHKQISVVQDVHTQSSHLGIQKCLTILKRRFYWPRMEETVNLVVNSCEACSREKNKCSRDKAPLSGTITGQPFERVAIDLTGPFNMTAHGNKYTLGIIDHFSKFCSLIPIKDTSAKTVAQALLDHWISFFGAPIEIISDNGTSFKNLLKSHLCKMMGIKEVFSPPYYPQANGLVERLFGTSKAMMKLVARDHKCDWDESLSMVNLALRNSVNKATGYTPFEILFAKRARLPVDWQFPEMLSMEDTNVSDYILSIRSLLRQIENNVRKNLAIELKRQADYYNKNTLERKLDVGDQVLVRETRNGEHETCKKYKFHGPFVIQKKLGEWTYELLDVDSGHTFRRSYNQVKRFHKPLEREKTSMDEEKKGNRQSAGNKDLLPTTDSCVSQPERPTVVRRSTRLRRKTKRYGYDD